MDSLVTTLARKYIHKLQSENAAADSVEFKMDSEQQSSIGTHSDGVSGQLIYHRAEDEQCNSEMVFVKYVAAEDQSRKYSIHSMFHNEIHFYTQVVPFLDTLRGIRHLLPQFLDHQTEGPGVAIMFQHLGARWQCNNHRSLLDYAHLRLMVRKLGEFHAYSFAARARAETRFQQLSNFSAARVEPMVHAHLPRFQPTLERCVQSLGQDRLYADAVPRLQTRLVHNLSDFVIRSYTSTAEDPFYVLSHLSFNQGNVLFAYDDSVPVDMKILDWQTYSFTSLGNDLMGALYLETSRQTRDRYWDQLLEAYHEALATTFACNSVPTRKQVLRELQRGVGSTIFVMAVRATKALVAGNLKSSAIWNEELLTEMLRDMIDKGLL